MIKRMSLVIALTLSMLLVAVTQQAHADSLVCEYRGQFLIYTEVDESEDKDAVKSVHLSQVNSTVYFFSGKEFRYGSIIPCVMIKEERGETKFLQEYLSQFE